MDNKFYKLSFLIISIIILLSGCSKYEKDKSYDTGLYGSYSKETKAFISDDVNDINEDTNYSYYFYEKYKINTDNTCKYNVKEIIENEVTKDSSANSKVLSTEEISNDITKITLDQEITEWSTGETSNQIIYKYKNILGQFFKIEVPKGKTFKLQLSEYVWFDEEGQYHLCNGNNCQCSESNPKYIKKDNIIYFKSLDEEHKNCYTIAYYIVDDGLFFPNLFKEK